MYAIFLQFTLYQNFADIKYVLKSVDPLGLGKENLEEKVTFSSSK